MTDNAASKKVEGKGSPQSQKTAASAGRGGRTQGAHPKGAGTKDSTPRVKTRIAGNLTFSLVVIMLGILSVLVLVLVGIVLINSANDKIIEYSKWVLTTLVGTFGAWIGAGAAYFFGKESLVESGASTEAAMSIQQDTLQGAAGPKYIRELALTPMDDTFKFNSSETKTSGHVPVRSFSIGNAVGRKRARSRYRRSLQNPSSIKPIRTSTPAAMIASATSGGEGRHPAVESVAELAVERIRVDVVIADLAAGICQGWRNGIAREHARRA